eukprot:267233-Rhodomonas_salina.1
MMASSLVNARLRSSRLGLRTESSLALESLTRWPGPCLPGQRAQAEGSPTRKAGPTFKLTLKPPNPPHPPLSGPMLLSPSPGAVRLGESFDSARSVQFVFLSASVAEEIA